MGELTYKLVGLHMGQMGASWVKNGNYYYGAKGKDTRDESCSKPNKNSGEVGSSELHLFVTNKGCAVPKTSGTPMECLYWKQTAWEHTPYGPAVTERDCDYVVS